MTFRAPPPSTSAHGTIIKGVLVLGLLGVVGLGVFVLRWRSRATLSPESPDATMPAPLPCPTGAPGPSADAFTITVDPLILRQVLSLGWYTQLDSVIQTYTDSLPCDIHAEWNLVGAYEAFRMGDPDLAPTLDAWVEQEPHKTIPRLARASYWTERAWRARGTRYASETQRSQFVAMAAHLARARADVDTALQLDPHALFGYALLLERALLVSDRRGGARAAARGLAAWPASYTLRRYWMRTLTPRWGGSYDQMASFAEESQRFAGQNPELTRLQGYVAYEQGRYARDRDDTTAAIADLTDALSYGAFPPFLYERAMAYTDAGRYREAAADFDAALAMWPSYPEARRQRGIALFRLGEQGGPATALPLWERSLDDLRIAVRLNPSDDFAAGWMRYLAERLGR